MNYNDEKTAESLRKYTAEYERVNGRKPTMSIVTFGCGRVKRGMM